MTRWPSEKQFVSWLGLVGGRIQGGKRKGSVKAHRNRAGRLFSAAARALAQSVDKALGGFYRRQRRPLGGLAANVALARKLALLFYRLLRYGMDYVEEGLKVMKPKCWRPKHACGANSPRNKASLLSQALPVERRFMERGHFYFVQSPALGVWIQERKTATWWRKARADLRRMKKRPRREMASPGARSLNKLLGFLIKRPA